MTRDKISYNQEPAMAFIPTLTASVFGAGLLPEQLKSKFFANELQKLLAFLKFYFRIEKAETKCFRSLLTPQSAR
jgi:hypothetical protein